MKSKHQGQSLIEFAISVIVLVAFLLAIPIIAKIANANIMSIQALDYAAWRVREGNTDNDKLTQEVSDRYFGETALIVDNEKINNQGVRLGTGKSGEQIYEPDTVSINYIPDNSKASGWYAQPWNALDSQYKLPIYDKKGTVSINLPLQNLDVIPEITSSMTISKTLYVDSQTLAAKENSEITQKLSNMNMEIIPYNKSGQKQLNHVLNDSVITILNALPIPNSYNPFETNKISDISVKEDAVPTDRLAPYQP
mgnify:FL=1